MTSALVPGEIVEFSGSTQVDRDGIGLIHSEHVRVEAVPGSGDPVKVSDGAGNVYLVFRSVLRPLRGYCICDVCCQD